MIKTAIICPNNILIAFDERGRQILEYHSQCDQVKEKIFITGNTIVDTIHQNLEIARGSADE